jgi:hypothetical protein
MEQEEYDLYQDQIEELKEENRVLKRKYEAAMILCFELGAIPVIGALVITAIYFANH